MNWLQYLILVNIYLLVFYVFYALLLSRETFFQLNRIYLVAAALLSFFIPMVQSDWVKDFFITQRVQYTIYSSPIMLYQFKPIRDTHLTIGEIFTAVYLAGIIFLLARFVWQLIVLNKMMTKQLSATAFSFFNKVKLGNDAENRDIIAEHENAHARQWHSADVLIMETVMIINWFNPVVYFYRFAIKHIHEFIADRQALRSGTNKADYALLLLSQTFDTPAHQLINPFYNKSLLKLRIIMLQKTKSERKALIKYFLSAPLFILMLILSSATVNNSKTIFLIDKNVRKVFLKPAKFTVADVNSVNNGAASNTVSSATSIVITRDTTQNTGKVFTSVEQVPEFVGGLKAFGDFLAKNIKYPSEAREHNVQGRVIISFIVETDGSLSNIKVVRGIGYGADEEAVRVLTISPKWTPGIQNGKKVRVAYSVPINFTLSSDNKPAQENKSGSINGTKGLSGDSMPDSTGKTNVMVSNIVNNNPLYIIDGKPDVNYSLSGLDPSTIDSISILKDKNAIALYGDKAANGVIIITTKKNKVKSTLSSPKN